MSRITTATALAAAALAAASLAACGASSASSSSGSASASPASSAASAAALGSAADVSFAQLMIVHHEQAVEMADMALDPKYGASAQVQTLAQQIKGAQDPEIAQMQGWLTAWGAPSTMASASTDAAGDMAGMDMGGVSQDGMMTDAQMAALAATTGQAFDQMWLQMMISHHEGAIAMAQDVTATTMDPQVKSLAANIISSQQAEIDTMQGMLAAGQ
ncbi:MAG: DUF305 domain-containing protein [Actinobacteria bacterium]|nr:MAG: DUF305 domain-containing protein [Actinomycetota bacterium]